MQTQFCFQNSQWDKSRKGVYVGASCLTSAHSLSVAHAHVGETFSDQHTLPTLLRRHSLLNVPLCDVSCRLLHASKLLSVRSERLKPCPACDAVWCYPSLKWAHKERQGATKDKTRCAGCLVHGRGVRRVTNGLWSQCPQPLLAASVPP